MCRNRGIYTYSNRTVYLLAGYVFSHDIYWVLNVHFSVNEIVYTNLIQRNILAGFIDFPVASPVIWNVVYSCRPV
jgi:hypothetical protein